MVVDHIIHLAERQIANPSGSLAIYSMLDLTFKISSIEAAE
jgi:hypothetical protein